MRRTPIALSLFALLSIAPAVAAQDTGRQTVDQELRTMTAGETATERQRANLDAFLDRDDVIATAAERGIDLDGVRDGVATLDDAAVSSLTSRIAEAVGDDEDLVGGDTFVVTSSTVIIILLVIILIVVS